VSKPRRARLQEGKEKDHLVTIDEGRPVILNIALVSPEKAPITEWMAAWCPQKATNFPLATHSSQSRRRSGAVIAAGITNRFMTTADLVCEKAAMRICKSEKRFRNCEKLDREKKTLEKTSNPKKLEF
jgi:hypothetical protein